MYIHQIWLDLGKGPVPPERIQKFIQTWKQKHPHWTHVLWTDEKAEKFFKQYYPQFLPMYHEFGKSVKKVDSLRYFLMYHYGGLYVDADTECIQPFDNLVKSNKPDAIFIAESPFFTELNNSPLYSQTPQHPFWKHTINELAKRQNNPVWYHTKNWDIVYTVGTILVSDMYKKYKGEYNINKLDTKMVEKCIDCSQTELEKVHSVHISDMSWSSDVNTQIHHLMRTCIRKQYYIYILILLILLIFLLFKLAR